MSNKIKIYGRTWDVCADMKEVSETLLPETFENVNGTIRPAIEYWWKVGEFSDGELWMENYGGHMFLKREHDYLTTSF